MTGYDAVLFDLDGVLTSTAAVDGKSREDGVRDFLDARGVRHYDVHAIARLKQALVEGAPRREGVEAFPGSAAWVLHLRRTGVRTAVVSSSANCDEVLRAARIAGLFELTIDGQDVAELGLRGKPAPDGFLEAARRLGVAPERAVVVEDALAGVQAGRDGDFGLVIGVTRSAEPEALRAAGADLVVADLGELTR